MQQAKQVIETALGEAINRVRVRGGSVLKHLLNTSSVQQSSSSDGGRIAASLIGQMAARVDVTRLESWTSELAELCRSFVCGDGQEVREKRIRMAMLAAGAEGVEKMTHSAIAKVMHVPEKIVERENTRLFGRIHEAAKLRALPHLVAISGTARADRGVNAVLCARLCSEVLNLPVDDEMTNIIDQLYEEDGILVLRRLQLEIDSGPRTHSAASA